jgi:hypothetical protein
VFCGEQLFWPVGQLTDGRIRTFRQCFVVSICLLAGRSAVRWADWDVQTVFSVVQLLFGWSVSGPMDGFGMFRQCFVVSSCLYFGLSAVR